jgi:hypothetical protein
MHRKFGALAQKFARLVGSYRHLDYRFGQASGMQSVTFSGPAVSFAFRF